MKSHELSHGARRWLLIGRWLVLTAAVAVTFLLVDAGELHGVAISALVALYVYGVVSMIVVTTRPLQRVRMRTFLFLDLVFVGVAASVTGGSRSLMVLQFFVIIFVAALVRGLWGGLAAAAVAACISALLALGTPNGWHSTVRQLIPSLLIAGCSTGYLAQGMQTWARRLADSLLRERHMEVEERLAARARSIDAKLVQKEMDLARAMQMAALPATVPQVTGLDIAARSELAKEVGGDFYMFVRDGDRILLVLGDVSGRGIQAAFAATSVAHLLPWLHPMLNPVTALRNLNTDLTQRLPESSFVTMVMAEANAVDGMLHVWSAGHPPALLWRASTGQVEDATANGPLLGILPSWNGEPQTWPFETGDVLLLYSDGLSEVRNEQRVMFDSRVRGVLGENSTKPAAEILEVLFQEVRAWGDLSDDLTILVCRRSSDSLNLAEAAPTPE